MKKNKISIIVPTYNRRDDIQICLDSIINQKYPNLEIIVTDDNSADDTQEIVNKYIKKYPYIKYVKNKQYKQGPSGNKNNGLDHTTGDIIGIFDDDDILVEGVLNEMASKIDEGYDVIWGNCKIISNRADNGQFSGFGLNKSGKIDIKDYICGRIKGEFWIIFKAKLLGSKRLDDNLYGGESTLWNQIFRNAEIYYIHKAVRNYKINDNGVSSNSAKNSHRILLNYEKDIFLNKDFHKKNCPCWLAKLYVGVAYFSKLSGNYIKLYKSLFNSLKICINKQAILLLFVSIFPSSFIIYLTDIRMRRKRKNKQ